MRNKLLTGGIVALALCVGGLMLMANPNEKPGQKLAPETKNPETPPAKKDDLKAKNVFTDALDKMNKTKGYHFGGKMEIINVEMDMPIPLEFSGVKSTGDSLLYMTYQINIMGNNKKYELYQKGDKVFARDIVSKEQVEGNIHSSILQADQLKDALEGYKFAKDEKLNKSDHMVIEAAINEEVASKLFSELLSELPMPLPADAKLTCDKSGFRIWVDKKTSLISKMYFIVQATTTMPGIEKSMHGHGFAPKSRWKILMNVKTLDYDKDIEIIVPDEVKEVIDATEEPGEKE